MTQDNEEFLLQIQDVFLAETLEQLDTLEQQFLVFEKNPEPGPVLDQIFRIVHTIKGSAASVGFDELGHLAHAVEDLLVKVRRGELVAGKEVVDTLLEANDKLADSVRRLCQNKSEKLDSTTIEQRISMIFGGAQANPFENAGPGFVIFADEAAPVEEVERRPAALRRGGPESPAKEHATEEYLRVPLSKIDLLLNYFGEQVILQSALEHKSSAQEDEKTRSILLQLGKVTYELQQLAMSLRMVSMTTFFSKMERTVRDTSDALKKKIFLEKHGEHTELDKAIIDELSSVIPHLVRNCVDHGIEARAARVAAGKPEQGTIVLSAYHEGGFFFLSIADDGQGLDRDKILQKAISQKLLKEDASPRDEDIYNLIFVSGFSTKEAVSDVSGRGVGMDAVKNAVERMRGSISLATEKGKGTRFTIKLPLSMAIFNGMVFSVGRGRYILPSARILDVYRYEPSHIRNLDNKEKIICKGNESIPFMSAYDLLSLREKATDQKRKIAFVIDNNGQKIAIGVDSIVGQSRIVQKKLGSEMSELRGVSGGAILGDGEIALILNLDQLLNP